MGTETDIILTTISNLSNLVQASLARTEIIPYLQSDVKHVKEKLEEHIVDNKEDHVEIFKRLPMRRTKNDDDDDGSSGKSKLDIIWDVVKVGMAVVAGILIAKLGKL